MSSERVAPHHEVNLGEEDRRRAPAGRVRGGFALLTLALLACAGEGDATRPDLGRADAASTDAAPTDAGRGDAGHDGGARDAGAERAPLSELDGARDYRPFQIALVDTPAREPTSTASGTLGEHAVELVWLHGTLAAFVVPDAAAGTHRLRVPEIELDAFVEVVPSLDGSRASELATAYVVETRSALEALLTSDEADVRAAAMDALATLDSFETDRGELTDSAGYAADQILANLQLGLELPSALDFARCRAAFDGSFKRSARRVILATAMVYLGAGVAAGGVTAPVGILLGGLGLAAALHNAVAAIAAGVEMVQACFSAVVDLFGDGARFTTGVSRTFDLTVEQTWDHEPARAMLEGLKAVAARVTSLPSRLLDRLRALRSDDHVLSPTDGARLQITDVSPTTVSVSAGSAGPDRAEVTATSTAAVDVETSFELSVGYADLDGTTTLRGTVVTRCGNDVAEPGYEEACDGSDLGGPSAVPGSTQGAAGRCRAPTTAPSTTPLASAWIAIRTWMAPTTSPAAPTSACAAGPKAKDIHPATWCGGAPATRRGATSALPARPPAP